MTKSSIKIQAIVFEEAIKRKPISILPVKEIYNILALS